MKGMDVVRIAASEAGMELNEYLEGQTFDSVCDGGCTNCGDIQTDAVEPDAEGYTCYDCDTPTVSSVLVLAGLI